MSYNLYISFCYTSSHKRDGHRGIPMQVGNYFQCVFMATIQVVDVLEVGDMDVSQGLVNKYRIIDQVQEISHRNPNI